MTDPMFNPETGHGVECLCDKCILAAAARVHIEFGQHGIRLSAPEQSPRIIKRVMTDGFSTKDGLS